MTHFRTTTCTNLHFVVRKSDFVLNFSSCRYVSHSFRLSQNPPNSSSQIHFTTIRNFEPTTYFLSMVIGLFFFCFSTIVSPTKSHENHRLSVQLKQTIKPIDFFPFCWHQYHFDPVSKPLWFIEYC